MRFENRVQEVTHTTGTGNLVLFGAFPKFRKFSDAFDNFDQFPYLLETEQGDWEIGIGYYESEDNSINRAEIRLTSNGDMSPIDVQTGIHRISHVVSAEAITYMQDQINSMMSQLPNTIDSQIQGILDSSTSLAESSDGTFAFSQGRLSTITETYPNGNKVTQFFYSSDGSVNRVEETYDGQKKTTQFNYDSAGELVGYSVTMEAA